MTVLAIDCTTEYGSVAITRDSVLLAEDRLQSSDGFGHLLFAMIERVLLAADVRLRDIDLFAAAAGPGSFTGVRVGLSAVKGLGEAEQKGVLGISNLQAVASFGHSHRRVPVLDARRGEIYAAIYDERLGIVMPETVSPIDTFLAPLDTSQVEFIGQDPEWLARHVSAPLTAAPRFLAVAIARCAEIQLERGVSSDPALLDALYVRRSDAELFWRDR